MRRLALLLVVLAAGVAAAWLALRTPQAEAVDVAGGQVVANLAPNVEEPLGTDEVLEPNAEDDSRAPVDADSAPAATANSPATRSLEPDQHWVHVRVLDGATGKPIQQFGARVAHRASSSQEFEGTLSSSIRPVRHDDGRFDVAARSMEEVLQIEAPGYAPSESPLLAGERASDVHVVELTRGGSVTGRAMLGDKPAKSVRLRLQRSPIVALEAADAEGDAFDLTRFIGRPRAITTNADGAFVFEDLAPGTYELDLRRGDGPRAFVENIAVVAAKRVALGELLLTPGATLRGRALLPPGESADEVRLYVHSRRTQTVRLDPNGNFTIDDLSTGSCKIVVREQPDVIAAGPPFEFELAAGEIREVVLDLRDRGGMWIEARVRADGRPFNQAVIFLVDYAPDDWRALLKPRPDASTWRWWQTQTQRVGLRVRSLNDMPLGEYVREVVLSSNGEGHVELDLELAELSVDWRQITLPDFDFDWCVVGVMTLGDASQTGQMKVYGHHRETLARRNLDLGPILAARVEVSLQFIGVISSEGDGQLVHLSNDAMSFQHTLDLRVREHALCTFTDAHLVR